MKHEISGRSGSADNESKETLSHQIIVRRADIEKDYRDITRIYNDPNVIEHLAGFAPGDIEKNTDDFRKNIVSHLSPETLIWFNTREKLNNISRNLIMATPDAIKKYLQSLGRGTEIYIAESEGKVIGTAMLSGRTSPETLLTCTLNKVAVSSDAPKVSDSSSRGKGIAGKLMETIDNRVERLCYATVGFTVIKDIDGTEATVNFYSKRGYSITYETPEARLAWNLRTGKFKFRNVFNMQRFTNFGKELEFNASHR